MYKGLFIMKLGRGINSIDIISYLKKQAPLAKSIAVCFAIFTLVSCGKSTDDSMFQTSESAVKVYRTYLSKIHTMESLSTEHLIKAVNDWQTLRDSVFVCIAKDTASRIHDNNEDTVLMLHDSLQTEFIRLANSTPKTFKDVLLIKELTSPYRQDAELTQVVATAEPFFDSLDSIPPYRKTAKHIVSDYKFFLTETLKSGINSKEELLDFIREEDRLFCSFLSYLPELAGADLSAITDGTEKCCLSVFQSAEDGKLTYQDALIYFAKRTNRRVALNTLTCMEDINQGWIKTDAQARSYVWMLLQPYISLDDFCMVVLSDQERAVLHNAAVQMPSIMTKLDRIIGTDNDQRKTLPELLIKVMITSI